MEDRGDDDLTKTSSIKDAQLPWPPPAPIGSVIKQPIDSEVMYVTNDPNFSTSNPVIILILFISSIIGIIGIAGYFLGAFDNPRDKCLACLIFPLLLGSISLMPQTEIVIIDDIESK